MSPKSIDILLATYNGEKYLPEQLASFVSQTNQDWRLLIRDDNSTDSTPQIIADFAKAHPDQVEIIRDDPTGKTPNENLRTSLNFGRLLEHSTAPYAMFSDQDDVWKPEKIAVTLQRMQEMEKQFGTNKPLLVHTDMAKCDGQGRILQPSIHKANKTRSEHMPLARTLMEEPVSGHTMMMNRALAKKASPVPPQASMHDSWVTKVAALTGEIGYLDQVTVNHRAHGMNVSGIQIGNASFPVRVVEKLRGGIKSAIEERQESYAKRNVISAGAATLLLSRYGDEIDSKKREILEACRALPGQSHAQQCVARTRHGLWPNYARSKVELLLIPEARSSTDEALPPERSGVRTETGRDMTGANGKEFNREHAQIALRAMIAVLGDPRDSGSEAFRLCHRRIENGEDIVNPPIMTVENCHDCPMRFDETDNEWEGLYRKVKFAVMEVSCEPEPRQEGKRRVGVLSRPRTIKRAVDSIATDLRRSEQPSFEKGGDFSDAILTSIFTQRIIDPKERKTSHQNVEDARRIMREVLRELGQEISV